MLGIAFSRVDGLVLSAVREFLQVLVQRTGAVLGYGDSYTLAEDRLLEQHQFDGLFKEGQLLYSLLFTSSEGYAVLCLEQLQA